METFIYFCKASALLSLFLLIYKYLLSKESFLQVNRAYLLLGLVVSFGLPFVQITQVEIIEVEVPIQETFTYSLADYATVSSTERSIIHGKEKSFQIVDDLTWTNFFLLIYGLGVLFFFGKLLHQSSTLVKLLKKATKTKINGIWHYQTRKPIETFSFFNLMAYHPTLHTKDELQLITTHEEVHIKQWHSVDMLLANIACMLLWFLPFAYLYRIAIDENLEYIADAVTVQKTKLAKQYQYTLVNHLGLHTQMKYASYFFKQSSLKNRIIMLNKQKSSKLKLIRYSLIAPLLVTFIWFFQTETVAKEVYVEVERPSIEEHSYQAQEEQKLSTAKLIEQDSTSFTALDRIEVKINKDATDESLADLEAFFAENDQKLKFSKIKRNKKGEITRIKIKLSDKQNGFEKETYVSGNDPMKEYVIVRDFKNNIADIKEFVAPEKSVYDFLNDAKVIFVNGKKYEKDKPLAITNIVIEKVEGEVLTINAEELEEAEFGKIYELYENDNTHRVVYVFKNSGDLNKNENILMRLEINKTKDLFTTPSERAFDSALKGKNTKKIVSTSVYVEMMPEIEEKFKKHIASKKAIKLNGTPFDANQNKNKLVFIETFEFSDDILKINGVVKEFGFGKKETIPLYENKLATILAINENGEIRVENMNQSQAHFNNKSYALNTQKELIEKIYHSSNYIIVNDKKVEKQDLTDYILVYKNVSFDDNKLTFYDADLFENNGSKHISGVLVQAFKTKKEMKNKYVLWFKDKQEIEFASVDFSTYQIENNVEDIYMLNNDAAVVNVEYVEKTKQPMYVVNGKVVTSEVFKKIEADKIASVNVVKNYDLLSDDLKNNPFVKPDKFYGAVLIQLLGSEQNPNNTQQKNFDDVFSFEKLISSIKNKEDFSPIFVLNGKVIDEKTFKKIKPTDIKSVHVFKNHHLLPDDLKTLKGVAKEDFKGLIKIELKDKDDFEITVTKRADGQYAMQCNQGCAWEELSFSLNSLTSQYVNAYGVKGMFPNENTPSKDSKLADFQFKVEKKKDLLQLTKLTGTNWKELSFKLLENDTYTLTTNGLFKND